MARSCPSVCSGGPTGSCRRRAGVADADVALAAAGVGELGEAAVLLGDQELASGPSVGWRVDEVVEQVAPRRSVLSLAAQPVDGRSLT